MCVFFFKQKTAYEMRISDWSSDVCSSDLRRVDIGAHRGHIGEAAAETEADATDPFGAFAAQPVDRRLDILDPVVGIILAEIAEKSEERRVGTEWFSTCQSRWSP